MFVRSSTRLLAVSCSARLATVTPRSATPCIVAQVLCRRSYASRTVPRRSAESSTFLPESQDEEDSNASPFLRLEHMREEGLEPSQKSLIAKLSDEDIAHLPIVISSRKKWRPAEPGFTLPRRQRHISSDEDARSASEVGEYLYNTFHFPTKHHLKRFHRELGHLLHGKAKGVDPIVLVDSRSVSVAIGLPTHIGLEPPFPAKQNIDVIMDLLNEYRSSQASEEDRRRAVQKLRTHVVEHGFRRQNHQVMFLIFSLFAAVRNASVSEVNSASTQFAISAMPPARDVKVEDSVPVDVSSEHTRGVAQRASGTWQKERRRDGKRDKAPAKSKSPTSGLAYRLRPDDPKLPEAGTFVAQDGDAHRSSDGVDSLQEHVPFPTPTAKEMGIKKPTEPDASSPDDPKLPEAGTFVAPDGDAHKPSKGVDDLQENVPFPKPSADEMGIKKPTET